MDMEEGNDSCMARRIKHHMDHLDRHPGGKDQAIAIAAHECGQSKHSSSYSYNDSASNSCFERQVVGTFSADGIKIKGAGYRAVDTGDGYFTVLDVPLMSEIAQGTKGAPYPVTKEVLEEFVATAQKRYQDGHFCATAFVGHNPEIPVSHPDFAGFVLPNKVAKYQMEGGEKWTVFGDVKLDRAKFELAKAGKLPYHSPEVPWAKRRISGLAFLDSEPPYFEYAIFTIGEVVADTKAKFDAKLEDGKFMEDEKKEGSEEKSKIAEAIESAIEKHMGKHVEKYVGGHMKEHGHKYFASYMEKHAKMQAEDPLTRKPNPLPSEPKEGGAKMNMDPEMAAKFSAMTQKQAELEARLQAQDNEKATAKLVSKAEVALATKIVAPALKEQIASFAADWASLKDGEVKFDKYIEVLKPSLKDKPTSPITFTAQADPSNPVVAKFAKEGPDKMEEAGKFSAQWKTIKTRLGDNFTCPEEEYVKNEMALSASKRNGHMDEGR